MFSFNVELAELMIYDEIGPAWWGLIDGQAVIDALAQMEGKHVTARLNTPGGSVDEGIAIYNALKRHKAGVTTIVDSLAASMGSYLLQAGDKRIVASNAMVMIHDPWTIAFGNSTEMRKSADILDKYAQRMVPDYAGRSGKTDAEIVAIMAEETWYAGKEIVDAGFADEIETIDRDVEPSSKALAHICKKPAPAVLFEKRDRAKKAADDLRPFARREAAKMAAKAIIV